MTNSAASAQRTIAEGQDRQSAGGGAGLVIAVDGPAGSGKSSAARGVARALGLRYLDTGAMYRALTWWLIAEHLDPQDAATVCAQLRRPVIEIGTEPGAPQIRVDGQDVAGPIRSRAVSNSVSVVASIPQVRQYLVAAQREIIAAARASGPGIVAEGRDIGTVVAPDAPVKVFLTASESARARRRSAELAEDPAVTTELTRREQARRDAADAAQLARARDAVEIDTTALSLDEVIGTIVSLARGRSAVSRD